MQNPFLQILNNPATLITVKLDDHEKETLVSMLEEKVNQAVEEHSNNELHDDVYKPLSDWVWWLNNMWDGNMNYLFEQQAETIGIEKYELYKMINGIALDRYLDFVCEVESNIDNNTLDQIMGMDVMSELNDLTIRNDSRINR